MINQLKKEIRQKANKNKAHRTQRFFKTNKGEYAENDKFLGVNVPTLRSISKNYTQLSLKQLQLLLNSTIHEYRLIALLILVNQIQYSNFQTQKQIYNFYLKNSQRNINNWDLVDLSAPKTVGAFLLHNKKRSQLYKLAISKNLWQRRIAIVSTYEFIKNYQFQDTLKIAELLLNDNQDLIHKAVGWMLREIGKRDINKLITFLDKYSHLMPRTMLRYSIERLTQIKRTYYLNQQTK